MLRTVLQAVADGLLPFKQLATAVNAVGRGSAAVEEAVGRLWPEAPPPVSDPMAVEEGEVEAGRDPLHHLFEAVRLCRDDRGACLLLAAAITSDWGVDAEVFTGVDAEEVVDELLATGEADEAADVAAAGAEALGL
ncbi:MAG: hypothetical protein R3F65_33845 [bacterium]